jgi:hypothetical protein
MKLPSLGDLHKMSKFLTTERLSQIADAVTDSQEMHAAAVAYLEAYDGLQQFQNTVPDPEELDGDLLARWSVLGAAVQESLEALREATRKVVDRTKTLEASGWSKDEVEDLLK